jgi:hypothetical protein
MPESANPCEQRNKKFLAPRPFTFSTVARIGPFWPLSVRGRRGGHQAVGEDLQAVLLGLLLEKLQVHPPVIIYEEHVQAVVPALRDMMGTPNGDSSG